MPCFVSYYFTAGHCVVTWKNGVKDIRMLSLDQYDYLMNIVDIKRNAILKAQKIEKVYLVYMDEIKHVHWYLIPRYNEKGFNIFLHEPVKLNDFSLADKIKLYFSLTFLHSKN